MVVKMLNNKEIIFGPERRYTWINIKKENTDVIKILKKSKKIETELLGYALDENENAHVEYEPEGKMLLIVFNVVKKYSERYETEPVAFVVKENELYSFTTVQTEYVTEFIEGLIKQQSDLSQLSLVFKTLYLIVGAFFPVIKDVDKKRTEMTEKLKTKATNHNLLELSDLAMGLVYLVNATRQNSLLLNQLQKMADRYLLTENEKEELEDVVIEADQLEAMANLSNQIIGQISDTYNNLLNNNLNDTMRLLTIWSLLLTVPTIVTGFFGMNVLLPFKDSQFGWLFILLISVGLSIILLFTILRRIK